MIDYASWKKEGDDLAELRREVDLICRDAFLGRIAGPADLERRIGQARAGCERSFPDRVDLFDMVCACRARRIWKQFGQNSGRAQGIPPLASTGHSRL